MEILMLRYHKSSSRTFEGIILTSKVISAKMYIIVWTVWKKYYFFILYRKNTILKNPMIKADTWDIKKGINLGNNFIEYRET